jgi:hypothetical protein
MIPRATPSVPTGHRWIALRCAEAIFAPNVVIGVPGRIAFIESATDVMNQTVATGESWMLQAVLGWQSAPHKRARPLQERADRRRALAGQLHLLQPQHAPPRHHPRASGLSRDDGSWFLSPDS